jgi:hypothetical protein
MVTHATPPSQKDSYVRRVLLVAIVGPAYMAILFGLAGEEAALIATWISLGTGIASFASLVADFRAKRRDALNPWAPRTPTTATRYLATGGCAGAVFGVLLIVANGGVPA